VWGPNRVGSIRGYPYDFLTPGSLKFSRAVLHDQRRLCHTDLKPENILLVRSDFDVRPRQSRSGRVKDHRIPRSSQIKLIDFGR
jgi:serine/threonine protein kinase